MLAFPPFQSHRLLPGGHLQTLAGVYLVARPLTYRATQHRVAVSDDDAVVLHDDCPAGWQAGDRTALLLHGLSGCHASQYMQRIATKLNNAGVRTFRKDLRGCGAGATLARLPYHSGRSDDAAAAVKFIDELCPSSPTTMIGFSLGANMALKLLGELGEARCGGLDSAVAICPPVDLMACSRNLGRWSNRIYDAHFVSNLWRGARNLSAANGADESELNGLGRFQFPSRRPGRLYDFDDVYTAPISGFRDAEDYYRTCSPGQFVPAIRKPTLVIAAADDPMIPARLFEGIDWPPCVQFYLAAGGGHLGFIGRHGVDADCRWMDWRVVEWIEALSHECHNQDVYQPQMNTNEHR
ncbi:MAG: alpha/beta fold hydrolase [Pirellulales bacterium]